MDCAPTAPKPRQLLALLALHANKVVSTSMCIDELWATSPPPSAVTTVRTYAMRIRRALHRARTTAGLTGTELHTRQRGYLLTVARPELDLFRFMDCVDDAKRALSDDNCERAAATLNKALRLWQGPPLVDIHAGPLIATHVARLQEVRFSSLELRIEAELKLGLHNELIGELVGLAEEYPVHENLHAQLMVALFRSGRQAQALAVFRKLHHTLAEELGIEPSRRIKRLHEALLSADPELEPPRCRSGALVRTLDLLTSGPAA
ncbi:AfsR/SARP family transcriptional regulator [Streptomyces sp. BE147]|uniref:AfsR/SARP family transcriptional regulator n=1 Tax=unclassified Streptomyces TaxID=2593676 RepID=UPI002E780416|nr:AfsR/SARP family transcriptional regulator [Streptomyces sp. BE147]MEE1740451.1 AfsR/SARP family transcriptional regulator [Streptomyces sp. BE147]